jgi:hypothetical protein
MFLSGRLAPTLVNNIDLDPRFVNVTDPDPANWDLRIQPDSPCLDTGDNLAPNLPATDIIGNARVIDGDGDGNAIVDMGAYERSSVSTGSHQLQTTTAVTRTATSNRPSTQR